MKALYALAEKLHREDSAYFDKISSLFYKVSARRTRELDEIDAEHKKFQDKKVKDAEAAEKAVRDEEEKKVKDKKALISSSLAVASAQYAKIKDPAKKLAA